MPVAVRPFWGGVIVQYPVSLRVVALGVVCLTCVAVQAQGVKQAVQLDIPRGDLTVALDALARQTGVQFIYRSSALQGLQTEGLHDTLSAEQALRRLLQPSGYTTQASSDDQTLIIIKSKGPPELAVASGARTPSASNITSLPEVMVNANTLNMDVERTRDDAQPYVVFDRNTIECSGAATLTQFLSERLPMNTIGLDREWYQALDDSRSGRSQINLRGLGENQTLILIDGHRSSSAIALNTNPEQTDINGIPLTAVERIEILPSTASGLYGGSATGGVINIILRKDYAGVEAKLTYDNTFDTDSVRRRIDIGAGFQLEGGKTNILIAASYADGNRLLIRDRAFTERVNVRKVANVGGDAELIFGSNPPLGKTPNIRSNDGSDLMLKDGTPLNAAYTYVPPGYAGAASDGGAALFANAGQYNLAPPDTAAGSRAALAVPPTAKALNLTVNHEFGTNLRAFLEIGTNRSEAVTTRNPIYHLLVPADMPTNPFRQAIVVKAAFPSTLDGVVRAYSQNDRAVAGLVFTLPQKWRAETDYTVARSKTWRTSTVRWFSSDGAVALNTGAIDLLRNPMPDMSRYVAPLPPMSPLVATLNDVTLRVGGPLWSLPAGPIQVSALLEHRQEQIDAANVISYNLKSTVPARSETIDSVQASLDVPLISQQQTIPGIETLQLQVSVRYDAYVTKGASTGTEYAGGYLEASSTGTNRVHSTDATATLRYQPVEDLVLRASYGTGFLPPAVGQIAPQNAYTVVQRDPRRGGSAQYTVPALIGGNPHLQPERSKSLSAGVIFTPRFLPGLRLSVDYTRIRKTGEISYFLGDPNTLLIYEARFPGRVIRGPKLPGDPSGWAGPIKFLDLTLVNLGHSEVAATDVQIDYDLDMSRWGRFHAFGIGTRTTRFFPELVPGAPPYNHVGYSGSPLPLKFNAGLTWTRGKWTTGWLMRYYAGYRIYDPTLPIRHPDTFATLIREQGAGKIPSQIYHDVFVAWRSKEDKIDSASSATRLWVGTELTFGVRNLFNRRPPFDVGGNFSYSDYGDLRLATYYLTIKKQF